MGEGVGVVVWGGKVWERYVCLISGLIHAIRPRPTSTQNHFFARRRLLLGCIIGYATRDGHS